MEICCFYLLARATLKRPLVVVAASINAIHEQGKSISYSMRDAHKHGLIDPSCGTVTKGRFSGC